MSKVVHVPPEIHVLAKEYCAKHGLQMSKWVSGLIIEAIGGEPISVPPIPPTEQPTKITVEPEKREVVPVQRGKKLKNLSEEETEIGSGPPFWINRERKD